MFSLRRFTSLCIAFSFLLVSYTGILLFIVPEGRIAYWINLKLLGLSKNQYGDLHVTFSVLFLVAAFLHLYLNFKPLLAYLKNKQREFTLLSKEFVLAIGLSIFFFVGTVYEAPPFQNFLDFETEVKELWSQDGGVPPYGHAELSSLKALCKKTYLDLEKSIATLKAKGFVGVEANKSLKDIATTNNVAPNVLFNIIDIEENELQ
ncbi:MAG: DUF4405 domain-containing protein [Sulfurospirillum sp.]|nr:DUF4405 domain-containing protein [Sulfurospirillum sp.]